ncbi:hypothetical protein, partial [Pseudomonas viridiflava]
MKNITLPMSVFVEAVRCAAASCVENQEGHAAVSHLTDWWNATADTELSSAYGLALYVRFGDRWLSGNPEESWVDAATWAKSAKPKSEATAMGGRLTVVFFKRSVNIGPNGFDARAVDGSEGS